MELINMKREMIVNKLQNSIKEFIHHDLYLLRNNSSERSMAHRLAIYLENEFKYYHVDCEYNLNIETESQRKFIHMLDDEIRKFKPRVDIEDFPISENEDYRNVSVYPDIIIHHRGTNLDNLLVIEIKKSNSTVPDDFDLLKLNRYTSQDFKDGLKYQYGAFVRFYVGDNKENFCRFILFINGQPI
jgi:hypothetical protein